MPDDFTRQWGTPRTLRGYQRQKLINPSVSISALMTLIDFTLSSAR